MNFGIFMLFDVHFKPALLSLTISGVLISQAFFTTASADIHTDITNTQNQYNQQRQQALEQEQLINPNVRIDTSEFQVTPSTSIVKKTNELENDNEHCFDIKNIYLTGNHVEEFYFALQHFITGKESVLGSCMNVSNINSLATAIQNRIIDKGYVTTRVTLQNQNLKSGNLFFHIDRKSVV